MQHYKVRLKWSNPRKGESPPLPLGVVATEKGMFRSPSITAANFTLLFSSWMGPEEVLLTQVRWFFCLMAS